MLQSNGALRVKIAPIMLPYWQSPRRFNGLRGGRGSSKSHTVAEKLVAKASSSHTRAACIREVQNSIKDSVKQLIEDKIHEHFGYDQTRFKITEREIVCPETDSLFVFRGLQNHTAASIKSLEGFTDAWYEESQTLSQRSLDLATPTFRNESEQTFTWNPENATDPVDVFFNTNVADHDPDFLLIDVNWQDNPWFPDELRRDMLRDRKRDRDKYLHVWEGEYRRHSEARVFKNVKSWSFETPENAVFMHGGDFGFSVDPSVLVRCFVGRVLPGGIAIFDPEGDTLFIDREAYGENVEIDHTPGLYDSLGGIKGETTDKGIILPGAEPGYGDARRWEIRADSARPETISFLRRHGYPLIVSATKGPNSVNEGVAFLQNYDIVIHPRCKHTYDEFAFYSWKVDKKTEAITNELEEKKNHVIDSVRYAIERLRRIERKSNTSTEVKGMM